MMDVFTANEAKNRFGEVLLKSQKAPVQVTRSGRPVAMVISIEDYNAIEDFKLQYVRNRIQTSLGDIERGDLEDGETFFRELMAGKYA
ncbi:MAG: type II toxin-antitoxin system prevent-host-death family antitoxin [Synergistaceae bacterium]|nr:type II toxin-antitoxin system prevent-host-death family antitoxin [Synergistaceae bacterium]